MPRSRMCRRRFHTALCVGCGVLVLVMPAPASLAQDPGRDAIRRAREPVKGRYIVRVQDTADADAVALDLAAAYRGRLRHVYRSAVRGFTVDLSDASARSLAHDPRVVLVEEDGIVRPAAVQLEPPSWGLDRIDQRTLPVDQRYVYVTPQTAVNVYVIDSGIRISHVEFEGRAFIAADFVDDDGDGDPQDVANDDGDSSMPDGVDCLGHGTQMAGTIAGGTVGVAKGATVWALRVFGCDGGGTWSAVIAAIDLVTAAARRPAVVNLSLNGAPNAIADDAVQRSISSGITYVAAAGNNNDDAANHSPSRLTAALVVGATAPDDSRSFFSSWGATVDVFAPGEAIVTAAQDSDTDLLTTAGTSAAAAHAAGVAALFLGVNPAAPPAAVHAAIIAAATGGVIGNPGPGSPNRLLYSAFLRPAAPLTVTYPNSPVNWGEGSHQPITWTHNLPDQALIRVRLSRDGGTTYTTIADRVRNTSATGGRLSWIVEPPNTRSALVRVEAIDAGDYDVSDSTFAIADPYVRVTAPNGGERLMTGRAVLVRWVHNLGPTDQVSLALSKNGGISYPWTLVPSTNSDGAQSLLVEPRWSTTRARLRVSWVLRPAVADASNGTFAVLPR
jgi:subtilisin family serine protease